MKTKKMYRPESKIRRSDTTAGTEAVTPDKASAGSKKATTKNKTGTPSENRAESRAGSVRKITYPPNTLL